MEDQGNIMKPAVLVRLCTWFRKDCNRGGYFGKIKGWRPTGAHRAARPASALVLPQGLGRFVRGDITSLYSWQEGLAVRGHGG